MTVKELAEYLRVDPSAVYKLLRSGDLMGLELEPTGASTPRSSIDGVSSATCTAPTKAEADLLAKASSP